MADVNLDTFDRSGTINQIRANLISQLHELSQTAAAKGMSYGIDGISVGDRIGSLIEKIEKLDALSDAADGDIAEVVTALD